MYDMKTSAVTIRIEPDLQKLLDKVCKQSGRTRSDIVRDALKRQLSIIRFEQLRRQVLVPKPAEPHPLPIRDADDRWVLASAVAGKADVLVTGDSDLLEMASRSPLPIVDPRGFWDMVR